jgi:carboxypeptidase Q
VKTTWIAIAGVVSLAAGSVGLAAWQVTERVDAAMNAKIRDEGLNRSQVETTFGMLVDQIGPRLTASPAHKRAADYVRDLATKYGLTDARLEAFEFGRGWVLDGQTIEMIEPRYMPLLGYAEAWSPATNGEVTASAVLLAGKSADEVTAMQADLKGAAVFQAPLVTNFIATDRVQPTSQPDAAPATAPAAAPARGTPPAAAPTAGRQGGGGGGGRGNNPIDAAIRAGGAAVLIKPSRGMHGTVFVQAASREAVGDTLPKVVLAGEHYNLIVRLLQQKIPVKLRVNVKAHFIDDRNTYNVLAEIPGSDPALKDQVVMLGAHLDSWHTGTGATDNADGVVAALEAFRILKAIGATPRRTLRLAIWSGEEEGLLGSVAYMRAHLEGDAHKADRDKLDVYFNIDPGKGPIYGWYLENNEAVKPIFDAWLAPFKDLGAVKNVIGPIGNTDHLTFIRAGIPGFNPVQDYVDYDVRLHHTNADVAERIDVKDLKQNAVVLASFLYHSAQRQDPLPSPLRK